MDLIFTKIFGMSLNYDGFQLVFVLSNSLSNVAVQFSSVQSLSRVRLCDPMNRSMPGLPVHHQLPSSQWCHPAISSSVVPFSSCPQSLPASESFPISQLFAWGGQNTGVSALASFLPKKSQGWSPSECCSYCEPITVTNSIAFCLPQHIVRLLR